MPIGAKIRAFVAGQKPFANRPPGRCPGLYILWPFRPLLRFAKGFPHRQNHQILSPMEFCKHL